MTFFLGRSRRGYVPGRDPAVDEVMRTWQNGYCSFSDASIVISTFNVNGKSPPPYIKGWIPEEAAEFYAIGLQEMDLSVGTYIMDNTKKMDEWVDCIRNSLPGGGRNFRLVSSMRLVGIFVILFQSNSSKTVVKNVQTSYVATGISVLLNKLGNKGGVAISLTLNDTRVCFVNCHLAAGNSELERRNQDFRDISQLTFADGSTILDHEAVFWFGDLNYRINAEQALFNGDQVRKIASSPNFVSLYQYDQLMEQQRLGNVFYGFQEPSIAFRPTYKYDVGATLVWDSSEKARAPAWCDRVLFWKQTDDIKMETCFYDSVQEIGISDHKPVRAGFQLQLKSINQKKADAIYDEAIREADRRANELLPQIKLSITEVEFGEVKFLEPSTKRITVTNIGKTAVKFKFKVRSRSSSSDKEKDLISAKWLQVTPPHCLVPTGESRQIALTVMIEKRVAWELTDVDLQDILVLNLEHGRDYFIPVTAKYSPRCFAVTLERLMKISTEENLIDLGWDTALTRPAPPNVPREINRLVNAIIARDLNRLNLNDVVDNSVFIQIRNALEQNSPNDLSKLAHPVTSMALYSALMRLIDSLKYPLIPESRQAEMKAMCNYADRLWAFVTSLPPINGAVLEFLVKFLGQMIRAKPAAKVASNSEELSAWADVLFRDRAAIGGMRPTPLAFASDPRALALQSLCDYDKDVALFGKRIA